MSAAFGASVSWARVISLCLPQILPRPRPQHQPQHRCGTRGWARPLDPHSATPIQFSPMACRPLTQQGGATLQPPPARVRSRAQRRWCWPLVEKVARGAEGGAGDAGASSSPRSDAPADREGGGHYPCQDSRAARPRALPWHERGSCHRSACACTSCSLGRLARVLVGSRCRA